MPPTSEQPHAVVAQASRMGDRVEDGGESRDGMRAHIGSAARGLDHSSIMSMEFIASLLTWAGIGWLLDRWLGTGPWLLSIGALIGNAAGLYLIWLRSSRMEGFDGTPTRFAPRPAAIDPGTTAASDGADER